MVACVLPLSIVTFLPHAILVPAIAATAGDTVKLSGPMPIEQAGTVLDFALTIDGSRIVYRADQDTEDVTELYSVPRDASAGPVRLSHDLPMYWDVDSFRTGDVSRVVYAIERYDGTLLHHSLFSVPVDGSEAPVPLIEEFTDLEDYQIHDGFVVYTREAGDRLFSVPIDGSAAPVELAPAGGVELFLSANGQVVFEDATQSLFVVPIDGSSAPLLIATADFSEGFARLSDLQLSVDGLHAYYVERRNDVAIGTFGDYDLFRVPLDASHAPVRLSPADDPGSYGIDAYAHDAHDRVVYMVDNATDDDLFSVDVDGNDHVQLDAPGVPASERFWLSPDGDTVVLDAFGDLFSVPIDGSQAPVELASFWSIEDVLLTATDAVFVGHVDGPFLWQNFYGLYRVPIAGGPFPLLLNGPVLDDRGVRPGSLVLRPASDEAVYLANVTGPGYSDTELYAVPLDGSEAPRTVNAPLDDNSDFVWDFALTPDGEHAVYTAGRITTQGFFELLGVPVDGGESVVYHPPLAWFEVGDVEEFQLSSDQQSVLYTADQDRNDVVDLYTVPLDRSSEPYSLTAAVPNGNGQLDFVVAPGANRAAFTRDHGLYVTLYGVRTDPIEPPVVLDTGSEKPPSARPPIAPLRFTADSARVVYRKGSPGDSDLFSCAVDGSSPAVTLADAPEGEQVLPDFQSSPDGSTIVYRATHALRTWLAAVPSDASAQGILLNAPAPTFATVVRFQLSPDGATAVFVADQETDGVFELYQVPVDGSAAPAKRSSALVAGGDVEELSITPDGQSVVYRADQVADGQYELFLVPIDGSEPALRLTPLPAGRQVRSDFALSANGELVFYRADADTAGVVELYSVLTSGGGTPVRVSGTLVAGGNVSSFVVAPDSTRVVFRADKRADERFELFARSSVGPPVLLQGLPASADVLNGYRIDPDSARVVYRVLGHADSRVEVFAARLDASAAPARLNGDLPEDGDVRPDFVPLASGIVLYTANQDRSETVELFRTVKRERVLRAEEPSRSASVVR